jgi:hypothetical protein
MGMMGDALEFQRHFFTPKLKVYSQKLEPFFAAGM